jgi:hypothetical protein
MAYKNKKDEQEYQRRHYLANKALYKARARRNSELYRIRNMRFVNRYKVFCGCQQCGYKEHYIALDLHHTDKKDKTIAEMCTDAVSMRRLKKEIRKCVVLCSNCHRVTHFKQRENNNEKSYNRTI